MRFTDILTTASAIANYLGQPDVEAAHLLAAIDVVAGIRSMDELGRPTSPLLRRHGAPAPGSTAGVRSLAQRWFADLASDPQAELDDRQLTTFAAEVREVAAREGFGELFESGETGS
jgi:hypothetical protein